MMRRSIPKLKLTVLGAGPAFDPFQNNTSFLLEGRANILIDCGYSVPRQLWASKADPDMPGVVPSSMHPDFLSAIVITHYHGDHYAGIAPVLLLKHSPMRNGAPERRKKPLHIIGPAGVREKVETCLEENFPGKFKEMEPTLRFHGLREGQQFSRWGMTIDTAFSNHGKIRSLATHWSIDGTAVFSYSSDGRLTPSTMALFRGTPLLIHECYAADEAGLGPGGKGVHQDLPELVEYVKRAGIPKVRLVHAAFDQRTRLSSALERYNNTWIRLAREGEDLLAPSLSEAPDESLRDQSPRFGLQAGR